MSKKKILPCDNPDWKCSASTLNTFINDPCLFVLKYFYGMTTEFGVHPMRGKAIEHGVDRFYETKNVEQSIQDALNNFYELTFGLDYEVDDVEILIPQWTKTAISAMIIESTGRTPIMQKEINFEIEGVPFIGFLDYDFENEIIDLKTATKIPNILVRGERKGHLPAGKRDNVRQQVLYRYSEGKPTTLLYVSPENSIRYTIQDDEYEEYMKEIRKTVKEIKKILTRGEGYAINKYTPNEKLFKSFYYDEDMIFKAVELWKLDDIGEI